MSTSEPKPLVMSAKVMADVGAVLLPTVVAAMQFMKEERSYEVIFLSFGFFCLYAYVRVLLTQLAEAKSSLELLRSRHERGMQQSNTSIINLFGEVAQLSGSRPKGMLNVDEVTGAIVYDSSRNACEVK